MITYDRFRIESPPTLETAMELNQHLLRQMAWSHATFGPGERTQGVSDHIRKELVEVLESGGEASEWVDVVILALDGLTRRLAYVNGDRADPEVVARIACQMIVGKQTRNEGRDWPDWRTADKDKAIEHVRHERNADREYPAEHPEIMREITGHDCFGD